MISELHKMGDEFTVTLLSDGEGSYHTENTPSTFTNKLYTRLSLNGIWECALIELVLPLTICNVYADRSKAFVSNERSQVRTRSVLNESYIKHPSQVLDILNNDFSESYVFELDSGRLKCTPRDEAYSIRFSKALAMQLGFLNGIDYTEGTLIAPEVVNFDRGLPSQIFVTTDIIKPQPFGSKTLRLLRSVTLDIAKYSYGGSTTFQPLNPVYIPLSVSEIEHISIGVINHEHQSLKFLSGRSTLLLHFRRARTE